MKYIHSHIPKPKQAIQLKIKEVEQADNEAMRLKAQKRFRMIIDKIEI
jgi:hypothetical protein